MLDNRRFIVGALLISLAVAYLIYAGIRTTSMYYFNLDEFLATGEAHAGEEMRIKGWVRHGSMQWNARTNELAFDLARQDDTAGVAVAYRGVLPDMFAEGREVVVEGRYGGGRFAARQIMTSCPSKYEPAKEQSAKSSS